MDSYRILFITSSLRSGGAENHLMNLCRFVRSKGHEAAVCTLSPREEGLESQLIVEGIELNRIPFSSLGGVLLPGKIQSLRRLVGRFEPDLLHAHLFHGEVLAWIASHFTRAPLLATRHSVGLEFEGWRGVAARLMRSRFRSVMAVSEGAAGESRRLGYGEGILYLVPNAIDTARFRPLEEGERAKRREELLRRFFPGTPEATPIVGSVGQIKRIKNFPLLVELAGRFRAQPETLPQPRFIIFGEGSERENLSRLIAERGAGDMVAMAGYSDRMEDFYPLFDLFLLPSMSEGTPLALLEAMSCRVACIASDVGGVGAALGDSGMTVPPGDIEGFTSAIRSLLEDERLRAELARRARVRILELYDMEAWGESILEIYRSLLGRG